MRTKLMPLASVLAVVALLATAFPGYADPQLPSIPATNFTITSFGAVGNGTTDNAGSIQNAINAAASVGGGTVIVAAVGVLTNYLSGPLNLSNNVCLQINSGTKLQMLPMGSWVNPGTNFINGSKLHDTAITGSGVIDGQGTNWWFPLASTRPTLINFSGCTNVLIQNVTLQNPPTFHIVVKGGDVNVTIQGITINSPFDSHNTDGIDIGSTNALIRNCTINDGDDNIAFGSGSTGVTISNCAFGVGHGLSIGSSTSGGINNLLVGNCTWNGTEYGIHIKSDRGAGGLVQNLTYRDLTMTNVNFVVAIYTYYDQIGSPSRTINETPFGASTNGVIVTNNIPNFRNIIISNVTASTVHGIGNIAGIIWGLPEMLVSNVVLSHVNFTDATNTFCIYNAKGIQFIDCNLAAPAHTNTFTLYNADVTVTNSATNSTPVTLGGLALPPTNNTLAFFNATATVTGTNELGAGAITLGNSTLTLSQFPVAVSNSFITPASSMLVFPAITDNTNLFAGTFNGPLALQQPVGALQFNGNGTFTGGANPGVIDSLIIGDCGLFTPGFLTISGGFFFVVGPGQPVLDVRDGTLTINGGLLSAQTLMMSNVCGSFALNGGTFSCASGTFSNGQAFTVGSGATFNMIGGIQAFGTRLVVANNGTVTGCGTITGNVVINAGGTVQATCGTSLNFTGTVTNNSDIAALNGTTLNFFGPVVNNSLIDVRAGSVHFFGGESGPGTVLVTSTNSWIDGNGKWETGSNWSTTFAPSSIDPVDLITNAGNKTVTIDATTVLSNAVNGCLTISNLTVSAPVNNTNTLFLNNAGPATPLVILSNLTLSANGALNVTNSALVVTNGPVLIGSNGVGQLTMNGTWLARSVAVAYGATSSQGTLTIVGGTNVFSSTLSVGGGVSGVGPAGTGSVWITGGQLTVTNDFTYVGYGFLGDGQITMSNGTWTALGVSLGYVSSSQGTLTLAGGTTTFELYGLDVGGDMNATGTVWMTGGQLIMTNTSATIGNFGAGQMTVSNGLWEVQSVVVDEGGILISGFTTNMSGAGTLTIAGGIVSAPQGFDISQGAGTTGTVWMTGGQVDSGFDTFVGAQGVGRMIASNGAWQVSFMDVGSFPHTQGFLTLAGGVTRADTKLIIGTPDCQGTGAVTVVGGSLFVTNSSHNAVLDVENGTFTLSSGTVVVNQFVMTNACAHFVRTGGTLIYSSAILNPNDDTDGDGIPNSYELAHGLDPLNPADASADNDGDGFSNLQEFLAGTDPNNANSTPFHTTSVVHTGSNIVLTWTTVGGTTNQVQVTSGTGNGSYATNGFANLSSQLVIGGTGLKTNNYTDIGGATNTPSRFYRVRLVP